MPPQSEPPIDVPLHVLVSRPIKDRLEELSAETGKSQGAIVREALTLAFFPMRYIAGISPDEVTDDALERWKSLPPMFIPGGGTHVHDGTEVPVEVLGEDFFANEVRERVTDSSPGAGYPEPPSFVLADEAKFAPAAAYQAELARLRAEREAALGGE